MKLFYLCPDYEAHAGGVRVIYQHVDLLRRNGFEAYVVHERRGFRNSWFENDTPILSWSRRQDRRHRSVPLRAARYVRRGLERSPSNVHGTLHLHEQPSFHIEPDDVFVIPEVFGPRLTEIARGNPKVIFNQNAYVTFMGYPVDSSSLAFPYQHPEVVSTLVISEDTQRFVEYTFPAARTHRVRWSLNPAHFQFRADKLRQIAYMPRKGAEDAARHVLATVAARGALDRYGIVRIEGMDEAAVAACLRESLIFLSFGSHEGLPLPPAEAMACGAVVVGYDGFGGREYLKTEFGFPVPSGDWLTFAETLERVLALHASSPQELAGRAERASAFIAEHYSPEREEQELVAAWTNIIDVIRG